MLPRPLIVMTAAMLFHGILYVPVQAVEKVAEPAAPVIILKLDDITRGGARGNEPISPRWQRCVDFIEREHLKASLGIIGFSLEDEAPAYFQWIRDLHQKGFIEFWNHGYRSRKATDKQGEFESGSLEEQRAALEKTQRLARDKLGITFTAFGPHWSGTNRATAAALAQVPDLKIWFYGPDPKNVSQKIVLERSLNLEQPTFVPDFGKFKAGYEKFGHQKPYLALQGHPNQWDDKRFAGFVAIVRYLKEQGCTFMTVSEYVEARAKPAR